jgi:hypothetical protein
MSLTDQQESDQLVHAHHTFTTVLEALDSGHNYTLTPSEARQLRTVLGAVQPPVHVSYDTYSTCPHPGDLSEP